MQLNEEGKGIEKQSRKKVYLKAAGIVLLLLILVFLINTGLSPVFYMKYIKEESGKDSLLYEKTAKDYPDASLQTRVKEKAYILSSLELSKKDSIHLIVNLNDSLVSLAIHGVIIHSTKVGIKKTDPILSRIGNPEYYMLFSKPVPIDHQHSTIVKEPVVVRQAPKDTIEASLNAYQPDTLIQKPAYLSLVLDHNLKIIFEQEKELNYKDVWAKRIFHAGMDLEQLGRRIADFVMFRKQEYFPEIILKMPVDDLRSMYRALPGNACIVLSF